MIEYILILLQYELKLSSNRRQNVGFCLNSSVTRKKSVWLFKQKLCSNGRQTHLFYDENVDKRTAKFAGISSVIRKILIRTGFCSKRQLPDNDVGITTMKDNFIVQMHIRTSQKIYHERKFQRLSADANSVGYTATQARLPKVTNVTNNLRRSK